ncbi:LRR receptor-like serine/threonine-protein kinase EFR [Amborella trichopoda]|uniref:LRR receptor-like serine/threonine-protein kinase EFR n=1 Tax=Amborella trichopoda TaxID=13333 RepID=UPI0009C000B0|nr:LRR receptor-like serine/threonine-protein kinase EFR [Amborella trichopoda]|eukprot:XP_020530989.1 LRR receptor-like serine/threonine-protein kinase EFR [Amborella trichopoda]
MEFGFVLRSQSVFLMAMLTVCCVEAVALEAPSTTFNLSTDQYSLYQFKREISYDSYGMLASWTERVHVCDWRGVTCNVQKERVVALDLSYCSLGGTISPFSLTSLSLHINIIHGNIPEEIGTLVSLVGSIPPEIGELVNLTYLRLDYNYSSGSITSTMGPLNALDYLDLSVNRLYGAIPSSLGNCSNLFYLFLSQNQINGTIPASLLAIPLLTIDLSDNNLSGIIPDSFKNQRHIQEQITFSVTFILIRSKKLGNKVLGKKVPFKIEYKKVAYQELFFPTNGYDSTNLIGIDSFGSVYKGTLSDGMAIAVKVLHLKHHRDFKSFIAECKALSEIRQRDLIKLVTCCITHGAQGNDFKALILEYMCIGSLNKWVHPLSHLVMANEDQNRQLSLNLLQRLDIAIDVAYAVEYLHHNCPTPIVHCDLKSSFLDEDMTAHVGDFGLARILSPASEQQSSTLGLKGSIGYIAPGIKNRCYKTHSSPLGLRRALWARLSYSKLCVQCGSHKK